MEIMNLGLPSGSCTVWVGPKNKCPAGWIIVEGQSLAKAAHPALYAIWGNHYGETATHFNLPNPSALALRFVGNQSVGLSNYTATLGQKRQDEFQYHGHAYSSFSSNFGIANNHADEVANGFVQSTNASAAGKGTKITAPINVGWGGDPRASTETHGADIAFFLIMKV